MAIKLTIGGTRISCALGAQNVRKAGLEPARPKAQEPKSCVYTNFTTSAGDAILLRATKPSTPQCRLVCGGWLPRGLRHPAR